MSNRILRDGSQAEAFETPVDLVIHTKCPEKWKLVDMETGEEYLGSEIITDFAETLRSKVGKGRIGTWVKTKGKGNLTN
ncbi:MAG: hypothetical protein K9J32_08825 [Synechococcus lacustris]|nr:hypothetical protein [Synechococcus lacustris]